MHRLTRGEVPECFLWNDYLRATMTLRNPPIEVIARALIRRQNAILVCRNLGSGYCYLPGGHVEFGEEARSALARELLEECGLPSRIGPLLLVTEERFASGKRRHHEVNLVFRAMPTQAARRWPLDIESFESGIAFEWAPIRGLSRLDLRPYSIRAAVSGRSPIRGFVGMPRRLESRRQR